MSALFSDSLTTLEHPVAAGAERRWIPHGDAGTADTIAGMQKMVDEYKRHPRIRELAGQLIQSCPKKNWYCYAKANFDYCHDKIQYAYDPHGVEWVESPLVILDAKIADCDSICVLFASLCETIGLVCQYVTVRADEHSNEFSHVFARVKIPGKGWVGADCTMQHAFGWEPTGYEEKTWPASSTPPGPDEMNGLGDCDCQHSPMQGLRGMSDFNAEAFDPLETTDHQIEVSTLCEECAPAKASIPEQSGFFIRQIPRQNYLTGLGADAETGKVALLTALVDGSTRQELLDLRNRQRDRVGPLITLLQKETNPSRKQILQAAFDSNKEALTKSQDAIAKYNEIVNKVRTYTFGQVTPQYLSGLGVAPLAIVAGIPITVGLIAAIGVLLVGLSELIQSIRASEVRTRGLLDQAGAAIDATSNLLRTVAILGGVGAALYFGVKWYRSRRTA